jgi:RnfABCDGE-type electron transport complex B subunit
MDNVIIYYSIATLGTTSVIVALLLSFAAKKFKVESDPRKDLLVSVLPGANCGACGYPGCEQYAEAILTKDETFNLCIPGGPEVCK